jgi:hypothetical protein
MMVAVLQLPELPWPQLKAAKETHERLVSDKADTQRRIDELKAIADNLVTPFAEALRSGSEYDPGSQVTEPEQHPELRELIQGLARQFIDTTPVAPGAPQAS